MAVLLTNAIFFFQHVKIGVLVLLLANMQCSHSQWATNAEFAANLTRAHKLVLLHAPTGTYAPPAGATRHGTVRLIALQHNASAHQALPPRNSTPPATRPVKYKPVAVHTPFDDYPAWAVALTVTGGTLLIAMFVVLFYMRQSLTRFDAQK